ncbi:GATA type zinc finger protein asd-4 [Diplogelasinospora grovesii]|uniref:GATA type zinc finger protein asd-4 n=1 Tax=Diplogelasinospora grovesii TaxID=303347 RepID=A0AAN6N7Z1_9PEZI|nr:GATA type zinc finger protein asd-4 [Diplogelasinospora grovesii]
MATMANHDRESTQPTCQNCATSTTPLWRRDEMGAVLCNACGLFLKLHGRPRPISLKTDVIKSRNRVKTMRPDLAKKKQQQAQLGLATTGDLNGMDGLVHNGGGPGGMGAHRTSQKSTNGHGDDTNSPISRTGTPGVNNAYIHPMYQAIDDPQFQAQHLPGFAVADPSPGRPHSPMNGEMPQTHEQLIQANASLKTRVSELEVIQELYRGRLQQLENEDALRQAQDNGGAVEAQLRQQLDAMAEQQTQLQNQLEESHRRENMLKRRLDELELELKDAKDSFEAQQQDQEMGRAAKKLRVDEDSNAVTTKSTISGSDEEGEGTTDTTTTTQSES